MPQFRNVIASLLGLAVGSGALGTHGHRSPALGGADLILTDARVYTVEQKQAWAQAVAIKAGRILAVGSAAQVAARKGPRTQVVDLGGRLLMPAFGDAHVHPIFGGMSYSRCSLHSGQTVADYRRIIAGCIANSPGSGTIFGVGWEDSLFPPHGVPHKDVLDAISTERPLIFRSRGGHSIWLNSKALELAHITRTTADPPNGHIDRDASTGEPIGGLEEAAQDLVKPLIPPPTAADLQDAISYTARLFNSLGIASWHDAAVDWGRDGGSPTLDAYQFVRDRGRLTVHVVLDLRWDNSRGLDQIPTLIGLSRKAGAMGLRAKGVKYFLDGVIPQQTAAMLSPYEGTGEKGSTQISQTLLDDAVAALDAHGFQAHFHAIGDAAVRAALDSVAEAHRRNGFTGMRPMISHMNVVDPSDLPRFGQLGVAAIFQPLWACNEPYMRLAIDRVGPRRAQYIYPANSILKAGGMLAYGADWPVASADPIKGIQVALTRTCPELGGVEPLLPKERVALEQAVRSYTINVAYVNHLEHETGSIAVGKSADLIVLDRNIFGLAPEHISDAHVLLTLFRGRAVFGRLYDLGAGRRAAASQLDGAMGSDDGVN